MDLKLIGAAYGTDKILDHGYHRIYPQHVDMFRDRDGALVEIGVEDGSSLRMWRDYFSKFRIYGIDKDKSFEENRISVFRGDQGNTDQLIELCSKIVEPVWVINDDGSHFPPHQISTFSILFEKLLQPGGVYIIEDIETSYWKQGNLYGNTFKFGYKHPRSAIEVFKHLAEDVNFRFIGENDKSSQNKLMSRWISPGARSMIRSITFDQNCIVIRKCVAEDITHNNKPYRHAEYSQ